MSQQSDFLNRSDEFQAMLRSYMKIGSGGSGGPYVDGRLASMLAAGFDGVLTQGYITKRPAYFDVLALKGMSTSAPFSVFPSKMNRHFDMATWADFFQYIYWTLVSAETSKTLCQERRFETFAAMAAFLVSEAPSSGGVFSEAVFLAGYELVDGADTYPEVRTARNSLYSALRGRNSMIPYGGGSVLCGVDAKFNAGKFYQDAGTIQQGSQAVNWHNNVGRNFVWHKTGVDPGSNSDWVVWGTWGRKSRWNWPKVGAGLWLNNPQARRGVWDVTGAAWLDSPPGVFPDGLYTLEDPFILYDSKGQGILDTANIHTLQVQQASWNSVAVLVFPARRDPGPYYSFVIYPFGADTWYTERLDEAKYEACVRTNFRHERHQKYKVVPVTQSHQNVSMFNTWAADKSGTCQICKSLESGVLYSGPDNDQIPTGFDICRRDKETGIRSEYKSLFKVRRRIGHANLRRDPAFL